jgi:N-formylmaleamate deformylase
VVTFITKQEQAMFYRLMFSALCVVAAMKVEADQAPAFFMDTRGEGPPVYFIPGLASPGSVFDELAADMRELGYQTRVSTLAGFAGVPPISGETFLPVVHRQLADELAGLEGKPPLLIGHSLGGFMALWLGATNSEHLAGVIAIDGVPYLGALADPSATPESNREGAKQLEAFMASLTPEQYAAQNRMALSGMITEPENVERFAEAGGRSDPATVGRAVAEMLTTDIRPLMQQVTAPVVLIQAADSGANEGAVKAFAAQVADIPDVRHVVADQGRHFVQIDDPAFVLTEVQALLERLGHE